MTRRIEFQTGEFYHIYNRGVDKREVFSDRYDYKRFILSLKEFNQIETVGSLYKKSRSAQSGPTAPELGAVGPLQTSLVEIISYNLLPNHFHLLVRQKRDNGISDFMHRMGGYTWYYNNKYKRSGSLFQGKFKAAHIDSQNYLEYLSAYINGNDMIHKKTSDVLGGHRTSSYNYYLSKKDSGISINKNIILKNFKSINEYKQFVKDVIKNSRERKDSIKTYYLE